jgi:acyl-CoA-binding protein
MSLESDFKKASQDVMNLPERPSNEQLLLLYAYFKQANQGDISGKRPGLLDLKGRAKYDSWKKLKGTSCDQAMKSYIELVNELLGK